MQIPQSLYVMSANQQRLWQVCTDAHVGQNFVSCVGVKLHFYVTVREYNKNMRKFYCLFRSFIVMVGVMGFKWVEHVNVTTPWYFVIWTVFVNPSSKRCRHRNINI